MSRSLFDTDEPPWLAAQLAPVLRKWADRGVYFGTSSWKYPGWVGSIYSEERYRTRNKFSKANFDANCLKEYAETFPTVCGDFSFYQFPSPEVWAKIFAGAPAGFGFGLKVPESVTVNVWPRHARYGSRAGLPNEHFLNAELFKSSFLQPLEPYRESIFAIIFEFGAFSRSDFATPNDFSNRLETFLDSLPSGWPFAVEIRNAEYLTPRYFSILARYNVAHTFNAWTRMPTIAEQMAIPEAFTADFSLVRALLKKGRTYEQAVKLFEPYEDVQEPDFATREALRQLAEQSAKKRRRAYIFVNNRLEGNGPRTIQAIANPTT